MVKTDEEGLAKVSMKIPEEWFEEKERLDCGWREIIGLGIRAKKDNPQLLQRIRNLEQGTEENRKKLLEMEGKIAVLTTLLKAKTI